MGTGWQLFQGMLALLGSVALTYWLFVAPSRARRVRRRAIRRERDGDRS